jgi:hypothetical protein
LDLLKKILKKYGSPKTIADWSIKIISRRYENYRQRT